jgi:hypothetical protein
MGIALEDLTVDSISVSKVRDLLADFQVRRLYGVSLAEQVYLQKRKIFLPWTRDGTS